MPRPPGQRRLLGLVRRATATATPFAAASQAHGDLHWRRVAANGVAIAQHEPQVDPAVVLAFAALHDTQRLTDGTDPGHPERAALLAAEISAGILDDDQVQVLAQACRRHHDHGGPANRTEAGCRDADRLDVQRYGSHVRRDMLTTDAAQEPAAITGAADLIGYEPSWSELATRCAELLAARHQRDDLVRVYHGTALHLADGIYRDGLRPPDPRMGAVFCSTDLQEARYYAARMAAHEHHRHGTPLAGAVIVAEVPAAVLMPDPSEPEPTSAQRRLARDLHPDELVECRLQRFPALENDPHTVRALHRSVVTERQMRAAVLGHAAHTTAFSIAALACATHAR